MPMLPLVIARLSGQKWHSAVLLPFSELGATVILIPGLYEKTELVPFRTEIRTPDGTIDSEPGITWIRVPKNLREEAQSHNLGYRDYLDFGVEKVTTKKAKRKIDFSGSDSEHIDHTQLQRKAAKRLFNNAWQGLDGRISRLYTKNEDPFAEDVQVELWKCFTTDCARNGQSMPENVAKESVIGDILTKELRLKKNPWCDRLDWALVCNWIRFGYYNLKAREIRQNLPSEFGTVPRSDSTLRRRINRLGLRFASETGPRQKDDPGPDFVISTGSAWESTLEDKKDHDPNIQVVYGLLAEREGEFAEAIRLYSNAAELGDNEGQYQLGRLLIEEGGGQNSKDQGIIWLKKAADAQHSQASGYLGRLLVNGCIIKKNRPKGINLLKFAAEAGVAEASKNLGRVYRDGNGLKKDLKEAERLFTLAAENGDIEARLLLANLFSENPATRFQAYVWALVSDDRDSSVVKLRRNMREQMSASDETEAEIREAEISAAALSKRLEISCRSSLIEHRAEQLKKERSREE